MEASTATPEVPTDSSNEDSDVKNRFPSQKEVELPSGETVRIRLLNQFQHEEVRKKSLAAKARRLRELRDPESDSGVAMEMELEELRAQDSRDALVDELVLNESWKDQLAAHREVTEREEYEHLEEDQKRFEELEDMEPSERPEEEYTKLREHLTAFTKAVEEERKKYEQPRRDALDGLSFDELLQQVRTRRESAEASAAFNHTYSKYEIALGTHKLIDGERLGDLYFPSTKELESADSDTVEALAAGYSELASVYSGNS